MVKCGNGRLATGKDQYHALSLLIFSVYPSLSHNCIKLLTGFNGNSHFIIMHFTVRAWQCYVAEKGRKRELKMPLKVPQMFKYTCCRDSRSLNAAFFNMETRFVFGKDNVVRRERGRVWVWACFTGSHENQDIPSGQTKHPRELIGHDWVRMCGRLVKQMPRT